MPRKWKIAIALTALALVGLVVFVVLAPPPDAPVTIQFQSFSTNLSGGHAVFRVKSSGQRNWDVGLAVERKVNGEWSSVTQEWSYEPILPGETLDLHTTIAPGVKTMRGVVYCWKQRPGILGRLYDKIARPDLGTVMSKEVHIP